MYIHEIKVCEPELYPKINSDSNIVNGFSDKDAFTQCRNIAYIKSKNPGTTQYYFSTTL